MLKLCCYWQLASALVKRIFENVHLQSTCPDHEMNNYQMKITKSSMNHPTYYLFWCQHNFKIIQQKQMSHLPKAYMYNIKHLDDWKIYYTPPPQEREKINILTTERIIRSSNDYGTNIAVASFTYVTPKKKLHRKNG